MGKIADRIYEDACQGKTIELQPVLDAINYLETELAFSHIKEKLLFEEVQRLRQVIDMDEIKISKMEEVMEAMTSSGL